MAACAAFRKESRMKLANATNFDMKSGVAEWRDLQFHSIRNEGHFKKRARYLPGIAPSSLLSTL
jgi:hypothetical protein